MFPDRAMARLVVAAALAGFSALGSSASLADQLEIRGRRAAVSGEIVDADEGQLRFRTAAGESMTLTWDRVRALRSEDADDAVHRQLWSRQRDLAERLWRARLRLERGDHLAAAPIFESLFPDVADRTDATAMVVVEGYLRCRLAMGDRVGAVMPWLEWLRMLDAGVPTAAFGTLPAVVDTETGLCPDLPPVFPADADLTALISALEDFQHRLSDAATITDEQAGPNAEQVRTVIRERIHRPATLAAYYRIAAERTMNASAATFELPPIIDESVEGTIESRSLHGLWLVAGMVAATSPDPQVRRDAIKSLAAPAQRRDWRGAWAHYGRGAAMVAEEDVAAIERGVIELAHLPARWSDVHPYLAGFAAARAAEAVARLGQPDAGRSILEEFNATFPNHPAMGPALEATTAVESG